MYPMLLFLMIHNVIICVKHWWFMDFNIWCYIVARCKITCVNQLTGKITGVKMLVLLKKEDLHQTAPSVGLHCLYRLFFFCRL